MKQLKGKVAVITGAASGIGLAVARACADEGMKLVLADISREDLELVSAEFRQNGVAILPIVTDVSKYEQVAALAQKTMDHFGKVHLLVNNAGVGGGSSAWDTTLKDWEWVMGVNVMGVVYGVKLFTPIMLAQGEPAHIVNTASIAGLIAGPSMAAYRVSKHAVVALSESLYLELEQMDAPVSVSVLCPAWVKTQIFSSERNRPTAMQNVDADHFSAVDPRIQAQLQQSVRAVVEDGMEPAIIATHLIEAVKENRFYILTHPQFTGAIAYRMKDILNGNNPRNLMR